MKKKTAVFKGEREGISELMYWDKTFPENNTQSKSYDKFSSVQFHNTIKHWEASQYWVQIK